MSIATVFAMRSRLHATRNAAIVRSATRTDGTPNHNARRQVAPRRLRFDTEPSSPWLIPAIGGAIPLIALLIGGQLLFASKTYDLQKVALNDSIQMVGSKTDGTNSASSGGTERVALRVPSEDGRQCAT